MNELILGSNSPRRREILNFFSLPFTQISPHFDETQVLFQGDPTSFAMEVAERKALSLIERYPNHVILTADTVVHREKRLFLKPENLKAAFCMLSELSGKEHLVCTGVCIMKGSKRFCDAEQTRVFFHELTEAEIHTYHQYFDPLDKAGAYAIQRGGNVIVKRIEGCYYNVMGLPLNATRSLLSKVGIDLWDFLKSI